MQISFWYITVNLTKWGNKFNIQPGCLFWTVITYNKEAGRVPLPPRTCYWDWIILTWIRTAVIKVKILKHIPIQSLNRCPIRILQLKIIPQWSSWPLYNFLFVGRRKRDHTALSFHLVPGSQSSLLEGKEKKQSRRKKYKQHLKFWTHIKKLGNKYLE